MTAVSDHAYLERKPGPHQAQHGEDHWIEWFFCGRTDGFFVDVGAYDGVVISNTYYFESIGWTGVLVEPNPRKAELCRRNRPRSRVYECAAVSSPEIQRVKFLDVPGGEIYSTVIPSEFNLSRLSQFGLSYEERWVDARTLNSMLEEAAAPRIDLLSVDVEGAEIEVSRGFDIKRWRPRLVILESPRRRGDDVRCYFTESGYVYRGSVAINDLYVPLVDYFRWGDKRLIATIVDGVWYRTKRAAESARAKIALRTWLRQWGVLS